jgi:ribonuclease J
MVSITVYDGAGGIGGNKIYVGEKGGGVFLDFGKNFGKYGLFYEEFLKNRDSRGIHDLIHLDLIPKINIYRPDLVPSDVDLSPYPRPEVTAVLLSHAHVDHSGNIGLLDMHIPVIASPLSIAILKGMQDSGMSSVDSDVAYISPKVPKEGGLFLGSDKMSPHKGRDFYCTATPGKGLLGLLSRRPGQDGKNAKKFEPGSCMPLDTAVLPFHVRPYDVDHSIYGALGFILETDPPLAYTGDFRLHGKQGDKTRNFVHRAKDASVLIIEGTRVSRQTGPEEDGDAQEPSTEATVSEACRSTAESTEGLIIADFSPRNFERLETFLVIGEKTGRKLVVMAKDAYLLHAMECADGVCRYLPVGIYRELTDQSRRKWESEVVETVAGEQYVSHLDIRNNPDGYILCFSFFDMKHLLDIKPDRGTYIYSSCEAFTEEMEIDFVRLGNWLERFGMQSSGFCIGENGKPEFDPGYHASGHASRKDLAWVIDQVSPDVLIPVHTLWRGWFTENFENVAMVEEGKSIRI